MSRTLTPAKTLFETPFSVVRRHIVLSLCSFLLLVSCSPRAKNTETALYFGLSRPDGSVVPDSAWQCFERDEVMRVFPRGFTIIPANGVWKGGQGLITEHTILLVSLNHMSTALSQSIDTLRERYTKTFGQESVMRVDKEVDRWDF